MQATLVREEPVQAYEVEPESVGRQTRVRARSAVLWGLAAFLICQVGLRIVIENWHRELRDPTFEIKYNQFCRQLAKCPTSPVVIAFLGSSMTAHGMRADIVEAPLSQALNKPVVAFNFGTSLAGPLTNLMSMQRLLRRGVRPDLVVVELSPLFHDAMGDPTDLVRFPASMLDQDDLPTIRRYNHDPYLGEEWWDSFLVPVYGHRLTILNQTARMLVPYQDQMELWTDMDDHGWRRLETPSPEHHAEVLGRLKESFGPRLGNYKSGPVPLKALHDLAALLKKEKIAAVFVQMPEGPLMRSLYESASLAKILDDFAVLCRTHEFPMIQARPWLQEVMFTDSFHLTEVGAEAFVQRLGQEAILPMLTRRLPQQ